MHEKKHSQQQEQENRSKDRLQQEFEDEMEEMIMDLRFFICQTTDPNGGNHPENADADER